MIGATALRLAGPGACLVRRPRGVGHVYVGRLTHKASVPGNLRPLCGIRSKRLRLVVSSRQQCCAPRLCLRCSTLLEQRRQPTPVLRSRDDYRRAYAETTLLQLAHDAEAAQSRDELDQVAHLSLLLFGQRVCATTVLHRPYGDTTLHQLVTRLRSTTFERDERGAWAQTLNALAVVGYETTKARRIEAAQERRERIARLGSRNAEPTPRQKGKA